MPFKPYRKIQILKTVLQYGSLSVTDVSLMCDITIYNARKLLKNYLKQGLLSRYRTIPDKKYYYEITEKGIKRLKYYQKQ